MARSRWKRLRDGSGASSNLVALDGILTRFPAVTLTDRGRVYVSHGRELGPADYATGPLDAPWVRLFDGTGALVALATPDHARGSLHPSVVLI